MKRGRTTASVLAAGIAVAGIAIAAAATTTTGRGGAAGQSSTPRPDPSAQAALRVCARVFGGSNVGSASRTTIGDVRRSGGGPAASDGTVDLPAAHAFGHEPASALAYWCWVGHPGDWALYGIDARGARVEMYEEHDESRPFPAPAPPDGVAAWF